MVILLWLLFVTFSPGRPDGVELSVRLVEGRDRPVPSAPVTAESADGRTFSSRTGIDGRCVLSVSRFPARVAATVAGFAPSVQVLNADPGAEIVLMLTRSAVSDTVTVTAEGSEMPQAHSTQSVISVSREELARNASVTLDDQLRRIPGFALFRRSGSLVAHPTSQGVSLRGAGPSGASRTLVLADSIPLNDPFGGWVYWARIPRLSLDRVEVVRGGASELYGTDALGGVIQLFRRRPAPVTFEAEGLYGTMDTADFAFYASHRLGRHGMSVAGDLFRTGGYNQIAPAQRGPVDIRSDSSHGAFEALWDFSLKNGGRVFATLSRYGEDRGNGTPLQVNDTDIRSASAGASFVTNGKNEWSLQSFAVAESFDSTFSAIASDRSAESLTRLQRVPARSAGAQVRWRRTVATRHFLLGGSDYSVVRGTSDEIAYVAGNPGARISAGGRQDRVGFYVQDLFRVSERLQVLAGIRRDAWRNGGEWRGSHLSPKVAARLELGSTVALRASASRSFRTPTLNELYRSFRVGSVVTLANRDLGPERSTSAEIGFDYAPARRFSLRATLFTSRIEGNIANVTLSSTPSLITRRRDNLGATRSRGVEMDASFRLSESWLLSGGYFLSDAVVREAPRVPELVGLRLPQVPRHQAVLQLDFAKRRYFVNAAVRFSSRQFDDDLNRFPLGRYGILDLSAGRDLTRYTQLFFACENLSDETYVVGRTPVETIGMPRRLHAGLRFRFE